MRRPHPFRSFGLTVATCALVAASLGGGVAQAAAPAQASAGSGAERALADRYIVVFDGDVPLLDVLATRLAAVQRGAVVHHTYRTALRGFAATLPAAAVEALRRNPLVDHIERDQVVELSATQSDPPWGLDRIDQRNLPLSTTYTYDSTGAGVKAYIIDTGIRFDHADFGGRAVSGFDAIDGGAADDCHGHGTHVAGTVGGRTYGVAKGVSLVGVRVLNCQGSGTNSQVIAGIDWVTANHQPGQPAVANMSLGGSATTAIDTAVRNSIADGVTYAVAAGNGNLLGMQANACNYSPARVPEAITVSATERTDRKASWANYGSCLDLFAPGVSIQSAWHTSSSATNTISGTSMATPHVAGAAARYLQGSPSASPSAVRNHLVSTATPNVVGSAGSGSPNRLLYTGGGGGSTGPAPAPEPSPTGCAAYPQVSTGSLTGSGDADILPGGSEYSTTTTGEHQGCLDGPSGVDFDLYLQKWNGYSWSSVARGISAGPDEEVSYSGTSGRYRWRVVSYSGAGDYTFGMRRP